MTVINKSIKIRSNKANDIVNITEQTLRVLKESNIKNGIVTIFV
jgi:thiamine phosphate synthase YjbQ (UPF0047 family)